MRPIEILNSLYPRIDTEKTYDPSNIIDVSDPGHLPHTNLLAVVVSDLTNALVTFASMTTQNNLNFAIEPLPDDPAKEFKQRVRQNNSYLQYYVNELYAVADVALGPPGSKSKEELRATRARLAELFALRGRVLTAEVWGWIATMATMGWGQMM